MLVLNLNEISFVVFFFFLFGHAVLLPAQKSFHLICILFISQTLGFMKWVGLIECNNKQMSSVFIVVKCLTATECAYQNNFTKDIVIATE